MPRSAVVEAVDAVLDAGWSHTEVVPFNTSYEAPVDGDGNPEPFLLVQYPISDTRHLTLGRIGPSEELGTVLFRLHTARGVGIATALEWADELAALFHRRNIPPIRYGDASSPRLDDDADLGNYLQTSIVVNYSFRFQNE